MNKVVCVVSTFLRHDGVPFHVGSDVELSNDEARPLLAVGAVVLKSAVPEVLDPEVPPPGPVAPPALDAAVVPSAEVPPQTPPEAPNNPDPAAPKAKAK